MWNIVLNSLFLAVLGTVFLRFAGRKSLAQMTTPQIVILLTIGSILGSEVGGKGLAYSLLASATFIAFLVVTEWVALHWNRAETVLKGKAIPVIFEGTLIVENLKKLRMTVDDLEKRLRIAGIARFQDVKSGTIEDNGEFGYELMPHAKPVTLKDLESLLGEKLSMNPVSQNIFSEVNNGRHDHDILKTLQ
ncbi:DUF421 domain-containing protein [Paenibacillus sp. TAB 01]|uniref:DUF421 domain-containing protein n=1 Tax=Paenibacillus sp. TAB 01 TaxID=3368988 RepID=UPI003750DF81